MANVHKIARNWDTIILLKRPVSEFAIWEKPDAVAASTDDQKTSNSPELDQVAPDGESGRISIAQGKGTPAVDCDTDLDHDETACGSSGCCPTPTPSEVADGGVGDLTSRLLAAFQDLSIQVPAGSVQYLVSSEHLKMASPVLTEMLVAANRSGGESECAGDYCIVIDDCDEQAVLVLLNIIHLRNRQVLRVVDLDTLTKLAILIDHYKCFEETEVFTSMWTVKLESSSPPPTTYCRRLILWLYIAYVFRLDKVFFGVTATAVELCTDGKLRTVGLPIPSSVTKSINDKRCDAIDAIDLHLRSRMLRFRSPQYECPSRSQSSLQCGSILLGAIVKEMDNIGLYASTFKTPFDGVSVYQLRHSIRLFQEIRWFDPQDKKHPHPCNLVNRIKFSHDPTRDDYGINLEDKVIKRRTSRECSRGTTEH